MIYIENSVEKVIVLKAFQCSDIRLFPGFNQIEVEDKAELEPYLSSNVAKGHLNGYTKNVILTEKQDKNSDRIDNLKQVPRAVKIKPSLRIVTEELDEFDIKEAVNAREKNEMLNKSGLTIKRQTKEIEEKSVQVGDQQKQIDELKSINSELLESVQAMVKENKKLFDGFEHVKTENKQIAQGMKMLKGKIKEAGIEV